MYTGIILNRLKDLLNSYLDHFKEKLRMGSLFLEITAFKTNQ